ncbi:hypothetical protein HTT03_09250 [Sulfitobacter sp. S0837]|uniref:DUF3226 domain-containing protein n=1 Tax=Sulfitobacter maritimus TaxID=2741719 RepID=UPI001582CEB8|nr:DUF3226 domain-containing protein [Sulfitobacter maritimus]NUH65471.1 hypothetical protein [Sulfitobacter maritimus]
MPYSVIFTEGASDSALLTGAFTRIGFSSCRKLSEIPESIVAHFPKAFPASGDLLNRVNSYPEVLVNEDHYVAIINTGGLSKLGAALKKSVLLIKEELPARAIVFVDADDEAELQRFQTVSETVSEHFIEFANSRLGVEGINAPETIGEIKSGVVDTGVYIWPGAGLAGTLERVLLDGVRVEFPDVFELLDPVPEEVLRRYTPDHEICRILSSGFNTDKAKATMMGGAISPGANFNVYISKESRRLDRFFSAPALARLLEFLERAFTSEQANV